MKDSESFEVPCRICGNAVTLATPHTGSREMDRMLIKMATNGAAHDGCIEQMNARAKREEAANLVAKRAASWKMLCDPLYRDSEQWLAEKPRKVNNGAIAKARLWVHGPKGLIMHGKRSGTGKTTAAWLVLKKEVELGRFVVAMTHTEFSRQATMLARDASPETKRWRTMLSMADILFVDDLGKSKFKTADNSGKAGEELLFEILDERVVNLRPCIFTMNSTGDELKEAMSPERGEAFVRRLREFCEAINFDKGMV